MQASVRENYLLTEVMTAAPQRLHLMLIEAAIRCGERALAHWHANEDEAAAETLVHAQEIVGEMLSGINHEIEPNLSKRVASIYLFIFRSLMDANIARDEAKVRDALRILNLERETWQELCRKLGASQAQAPGAMDAVSLKHESGAGRAPLPAVDMDVPSARSGGFSLDA